MARIRSASAAIRVSSACFSAISTSTVLRRLAISLSRAVMTRSVASVAPDPRIFGRGPRRRFLQRLLMDRDRLFHHRGLDILLATDFQLAQVALAADAGFVEAAVGGDAGTLDFLAGGDLGLLQRLDAGDLELLDRAPACDPRRLQRLFARDIGGLDFLARHDLRLLDLAVGIDALRPLGGERDHALLVGDLDRLLLVDVEHFAGLGRGDALAFERQLDVDALTFDGVAALELGRLDRLGARDLQPPGFPLGADALGGDGLLLHDPGRLDRFARGDVGFLDRAVARDFERADALFLGDARGFGRFARGDAGDFQRLVALDLELARGLFGADAFGRQGALAGDPGGFHRLLRLDLGLLHVADLLDLHRPGAFVGADALDD